MQNHINHQTNLFPGLNNHMVTQPDLSPGLQNHTIDQRSVHNQRREREHQNLAAIRERSIRTAAENIEKELCMVQKSNKLSQLFRKLLGNVLTLAINAHSNVSSVAFSLLSSSFSLECLKHLLCHQFNNMPISVNSLKERRCIISDTAHRNNRFLLSSLCTGTKLGLKQTYPYRVNIEKIISVFEYIMAKLHYRHGMIKDVRVDNYTFRNLPMYERGGKSCISLFNEYRDGEQSLNGPTEGKKTLFELIKFMTKAGESKTGLLTFYVKLTHHIIVFKEMIFTSTLEFIL